MKEISFPSTNYIIYIISKAPFVSPLVFLTHAVNVFSLFTIIAVTFSQHYGDDINSCVREVIRKRLLISFLS